MKLYDIIIVGSGPAGLTAALYARREGKTVLVLEKESFGGQITFSSQVENYPTQTSISGAALAEQMIEQIQQQGAELELDCVTAILRDANGFKVMGENDAYLAKAVILATGSKHRPLNLPNEKKLVGSGVCYCALCDGAFFKDQDVAVIGGGNTALQDAILLSDICKSVTIIQNLPKLTGERALQDKLQTLSNVTVRTNATVTALHGTDALTSITIVENGALALLPVSGIFVAIGQKPDNMAFSEYVNLDDVGYIESDESCLTRTEGIFVAGDCRTKSVRQVVTATADGAVAALAACRYIG